MSGSPQIPTGGAHDASQVVSSPCNVCPRMCGAERARGQRGVCGAGDSVEVARAALHFWEEPVISGKRGSGTVFFSHCPLGCVYCQNHELAAGKAGVAVGVERLARIFCELESKGALNVNCVTPTHYTLPIREAVSMARDEGLSVPVVWNTSGYERVEVVSLLADTVDVYLADFKYADAALAQAYSSARDYPDVALAAIAAMVEAIGASRFDEVDGMARMTAGVIVRHLVLPGAVPQSMDALRMLFAAFGNDVSYSIMNQYTPVAGPEICARFPHLANRVSDEDYERVLDFADSIGMEDYYWQEGPAALESFIPSWDLQGVIGEA